MISLAADARIRSTSVSSPLRHSQNSCGYITDALEAAVLRPRLLAGITHASRRNVHNAASSHRVHHTEVAPAVAAEDGTVKASLHTGQRWEMSAQKSLQNEYIRMSQK